MMAAKPIKTLEIPHSMSQVDSHKANIGERAFLSLGLAKLVQI